jgi:hypothetical protein
MFLADLVAAGNVFGLSRLRPIEGIVRLLQQREKRRLRLLYRDQLAPGTFQFRAVQAKLRLVAARDQLPHFPLACPDHTSLASTPHWPGPRRMPIPRQKIVKTPDTIRKSRCRGAVQWPEPNWPPRSRQEGQSYQPDVVRHRDPRSRRQIPSRPDKVESSSKAGTICAAASHCSARRRPSTIKGTPTSISPCAVARHEAWGDSSALRKRFDVHNRWGSCI